MALSKRVRFEVLRRDNHQCRYCGATAPGATLVVDHVQPVALGGSDAPSNLVAACRDCNAGKTSTSPDAATVEAVSQDAIRWAAAMKTAVAEYLATTDRAQALGQEFLASWQRYTCGGRPVFLPDDWHHSVARWLAAGLPMQTLREDIAMTMSRDRVAPSAKFTYLAGIAWKQLTEIQDRARALLDLDADGLERACASCAEPISKCMVVQQGWCLWCEEAAGARDHQVCCYQQYAYAHGRTEARWMARIGNIGPTDLVAHVVDGSDCLDKHLAAHVGAATPSRKVST